MRLALRLPLSLRDRYSRAFSDIALSPQVTDRGFDHAADRERHLKPLLSIKNLIKTNPSRTLPLSTITENKPNLNISTRPIEFIRKFPSVFEEFLPSSSSFHPHIKLTPQTLEIDQDEDLLYHSETYQNDVADRLVKLLMISRMHRLSISLLNSFKFDLGLPDDFSTTIVPLFPDYFRVVDNQRLELVCWNEELAVSQLQRNDPLYCKGMSIEFPMQFPKDVELDKKAKKIVEDWQKVQYIPPYENAVHLNGHTEVSDKWVTGIIHEVLNMFVSKKTEREYLMLLGDHLGIRSRVKRSLLYHPEIFYVSRKSSVLLKDAYRRGALVQTNSLVEIRGRYIHLMNKSVKRKKPISTSRRKPRQSKQIL